MAVFFGLKYVEIWRINWQKRIPLEFCMRVNNLSCISTLVTWGWQTMHQSSKIIPNYMLTQTFTSDDCYCCYYTRHPGCGLWMELLAMLWSLFACLPAGEFSCQEWSVHSKLWLKVSWDVIIPLLLMVLCQPVHTVWNSSCQHFRLFAPQ